MSNSQSIPLSIRLRGSSGVRPTPNLLNGPLPGRSAPDEPHEWIPSGDGFYRCGVCETRIYVGKVMKTNSWDEFLESLSACAGATCAGALAAEVMGS